MRLYLDHDVDVAFAARLRRLGHDVLTTREVGHTEALDEQQGDRITGPWVVDQGSTLLLLLEI